MKKYTKPNAVKTEFDFIDVITVSGEVVNAGSLMGADKEMYEIYEAKSSAKNTQVSVFTW